MLSCSEVEVSKDIPYRTDVMGVPQYPGSEVEGMVKVGAGRRPIITYVLKTEAPYDSVVGFYRRWVGEGVAAGQLYSITSETLMVRISEEGSHRLITITKTIR